MTRGRHDGGRVGDATDDLMWVNAGTDLSARIRCLNHPTVVWPTVELEVPPGYSALQRDDRRFRTDEFRQGIQGRRDLVCFEGDYQNILGAAAGGVADCTAGWQAQLGSVRTGHPQALSLQSLQVLAPVHQSYGHPDALQCPAYETTHTASAHDHDSHVSHLPRSGYGYHSKY